MHTATLKSSRTSILLSKESILESSRGMSPCCTTMPIPCGMHCLGLVALHVLDLCDFHTFSPLKKSIKGTKYLGQAKMLSVVVQRLQQQLLCRGDPSADMSMGYPPHCPWGLFFTTSTHLPSLQMGFILASIIQTINILCLLTDHSQGTSPLIVTFTVRTSYLT